MAAAACCGPFGMAFWSCVIAGLKSYIKSTEAELQALMQKQQEEEKILREIIAKLNQLKADIEKNEADLG